MFAVSLASYGERIYMGLNGQVPIEELFFLLADYFEGLKLASLTQIWFSNSNLPVVTFSEINNILKG